MTSYQPYQPPDVVTPEPPVETPTAEPDNLVTSWLPGQPISLDRPHPWSTAVLVIGLVGVFVPVVGLVAWVMGGSARRECRGGVYQVTTALRVGWGLGILATCLQVAVLVVVLGGIGLLMLIASSVG
jgi:hypothetical protein